MIEELYKRQAYPADLQDKIERMGATAISIANRWMLGWERRVEVLWRRGDYLECLKTQAELEKTILSEEPNSSHLSRWEILKAHDVIDCPPDMIPV